MIIVFGHQKGGTGKSTLTVNMAVELQRQGKDVLLVDADPTIRTTSNFTTDREEAGLPSIQSVQKSGSLHKFLEEFRPKFDHILVDVPGKDSKEMRTALTAADMLINPTRATQADLDAVAGLLETVEGAQDFNEDLKSMLVLNFVSSNVFTKEREEAQSYLEDFPRVRLAETVLHQRKAFADCLADGKGVVEMRDAKAKAEIQLLTQEVFSW